MGLWLAIGGIGCALVMCLAAAGVGGYFWLRKKPEVTDEKPMPSVAKDIPATTQGLADQFSALLDALKAKDEAKAKALAKEFLIPNHRGWLKTTFGDPLADRAIADYDADFLQKDFAANLVADMRDRLARGQTEIRAAAIDAKEKTKATGRQLAILERMKSPVPLYTVAFISPKQGGGTFLMDSFVYVDGKFRVLGRLQSLSK